MECPRSLSAPLAESGVYKRHNGTSSAAAKASGGLRPRVDTGEPRQGDDVEQGGLDVAAPVIGEKQVRATVVLGQISLRKKPPKEGVRGRVGGYHECGQRDRLRRQAKGTKIGGPVHPGAAGAPGAATNRAM